MKIVVTGYSGQLGYDVVQYGLTQGLEMIGVSSKELDITDEEDVLCFLNKHNPDAVIHCAAYTAVDQAEDDTETAWKVNVEGTNHLVSAAKKVKAKFMYISTDYVFNGEGNTPFHETEEANPINYYGKTKYHGELAVKKILEQWFIVRISWVFGKNGNNFVKTMLKLADSRSELNVVGDQVGSPTYTIDLARLLIDIIQTDKYGTYHASNEGFCSWAEFAAEIFSHSNKEVKVNAIATEDYPTRATRPKNSRMLKHNIVANGFKPLPDWKDAVNRYLSQLNKEVQ